MELQKHNTWKSSFEVARGPFDLEICDLHWREKEKCRGSQREQVAGRK